MEEDFFRLFEKRDPNFMKNIYPHLSKNEKFELWGFHLFLDFKSGHAVHNPYDRFSVENYDKWKSEEEDFDELFEQILDEFGTAFGVSETEIYKRLSKSPSSKLEKNEKNDFNPLEENTGSTAKSDLDDKIYRVNSFLFQDDHLLFGKYPAPSHYAIYHNHPDFWEIYKNILFLYRYCNEITFDGSVMPRTEVYDTFTNKKVDEECPNNLRISDYLSYSQDVKLIITNVSHLMSSGNDMILRLNRVKGDFTFSLNDPCYYAYCIKLLKAFIDKKEVLVVIDTESNMVLSIKYPCEKIDHENSAIKDRIVPLLPEKIKKTTSLKLPEHELLKNIEKIDIEREAVCYYQFWDHIYIYMADASNWSMTLCQMRLPEENSFPYLDYSEHRVKKYLNQFLVSVQDLRQTMRYLIDIEEYEKVKAFFPSFYYNYPNKEFISFYRATDSYVEDILPGWAGVHKSFFDLIHDELKYWIIDGKDWSKEFF